MNRPLKFRAWDKENKTMTLLGDMWICNEYSSLAFSSSQEEYSGICQWPKSSSDENQVVMQFTGLLDKNGKEIYEGDWISCILPEHRKTVEGDLKFQGIIEWQNDSADYEVVQPINGFQCAFGIEGSVYEIIGNIYESPELLSKAELV